MLTGCVCLAILSATELVATLVGSSAGGHPLCRRCGYDLIGRSGNRCSECGTDLDARRAMTYGRRRRPRLATAAAVALVGSAACGTGSAYASRHPDWWAHHRPVWTLRRQLHSTGPGDRSDALAELRRRLIDGRLSLAQTAAVADQCLSYQADRRQPWDNVYGQFLEAAHDRGSLDAPRWATYAGQVSAPPRLWAHTVVRQGDPMAFAFNDAQAHRWAVWRCGSAQFATRFTVDRVKLGPVTARFDRYPESQRFDYAADWPRDHSADPETADPPVTEGGIHYRDQVFLDWPGGFVSPQTTAQLPVGPTELSADVHEEIFGLSHLNEKLDVARSRPPILRLDSHLTTTIAICPRGDRTDLVTDRRRGEAVRRSLATCRIDGHGLFDWNPSAAPPSPVNLMFDVYLGPATPVRTAIPVAQIYWGKMADPVYLPGTWPGYALTGRESQSDLTLVFRPALLAYHTSVVDGPIWGDEVILHHVPVATTRPAVR